VRGPEQILREARTIAVVGTSPRPERPSHGVARYLAVARVPRGAVDLVDVFRRAQFCADVAREAAAVGAPALWLQLGVRSAEARQVAIASGMDYVEDACTAIVHRDLG
jgi:uncharacterized protein